MIFLNKSYFERIKHMLYVALQFQMQIQDEILTESRVTAQIISISASCRIKTFTAIWSRYCFPEIIFEQDLISRTDIKKLETSKWRNPLRKWNICGIKKRCPEGLEAPGWANRADTAPHLPLKPCPVLCREDLISWRNRRWLWAWLGGDGDISGHIMGPLFH